MPWAAYRVLASAARKSCKANCLEHYLKSLDMINKVLGAAERHQLLILSTKHMVIMEVKPRCTLISVTDRKDLWHLGRATLLRSQCGVSSYGEIEMSQLKWLLEKPQTTNTNRMSPDHFLLLPKGKIQKTFFLSSPIMHHINNEIMRQLYVSLAHRPHMLTSIA